MHDDELEDAVPEVGLVVVCSQEIDETAEAGKPAASFTAFDHIVGLISRAVARLAHRESAPLSSQPITASLRSRTTWDRT